MIRLSLVVAAAACLVASGSLAEAQSTPAPSGMPTPPRTTLDTTSGTLSDKLGKTNGVIKPTRDVDPAMHKPTPHTGTMPVVKPGQVPVQPGGPQATQPK